MNPRSSTWIQAAVIALAAAIGLGLALWYQNRPPDDALPAPAAAPKPRMVLHPFQPGVIPAVMPTRPVVAGTPAVGPAAGSPPSDAVPVPSQSSVNAWQRSAIDPMSHLRVTPSAAPAPSSAVLPSTPSAVTPPSDYAVVPPPAAPSAAPYTALPGVSPSSALPPSSSPSGESPSSSVVSPYVTTTPPVGGTTGAPGAVP